MDLVFEAHRWQGKLYNAEPEVHSELAWFNPDALPEKIIDYVKFYIEQIKAGKAYAEHGWGR